MESQPSQLKEAPQTKDSERKPSRFECTDCRKTVDVVSRDHMPGGFYTFVCRECKAVRRAKEFDKTCPKLYLETDTSRLPQAQLAAAMKWQYGPRGLLLTGDTGKGKTRIAWALMRRVMVDDIPQRQVRWFDCIKFGHEIVSRYQDENAESWLDGLAVCEIIFFDDFGKLKLTERAEVELFGLIERRCANMLPTIITTNDTGDSLAGRMTENRGPAMVRRLRDFSDVIDF